MKMPSTVGSNMNDSSEVICLDSDEEEEDIDVGGPEALQSSTNDVARLTKELVDVAREQVERQLSFHTKEFKAEMKATPVEPESDDDDIEILSEQIVHKPNLVPISIRISKTLEDKLRGALKHEHGDNYRAKMDLTQALSSAFNCNIKKFDVILSNPDRSNEARSAIDANGLSVKTESSPTSSKDFPKGPQVDNLNSGRVAAAPTSTSTSNKLTQRVQPSTPIASNLQSFQSAESKTDPAKSVPLKIPRHLPENPTRPNNVHAKTQQSLHEKKGAPLGPGPSKPPPNVPTEARDTAASKVQQVVPVVRSSTSRITPNTARPHAAFPELTDLLVGRTPPSNQPSPPMPALKLGSTSASTSTNKPSPRKPPSLTLGATAEVTPINKTPPSSTADQSISNLPVVNHSTFKSTPVQTKQSLPKAAAEETNGNGPNHLVYTSKSIHVSATQNSARLNGSVSASQAGASDLGNSSVYDFMGSDDESPNKNLFKNGRPTNGRMICKKRAYYDVIESSTSTKKPKTVPPSNAVQPSKPELVPDPGKKGGKSTVTPTSKVIPSNEPNSTMQPSPTVKTPEKIASVEMDEDLPLHLSKSSKKSSAGGSPFVTPTKSLQQQQQQQQQKQQQQQPSFADKSLDDATLSPRDRLKMKMSVRRPLLDVSPERKKARKSSAIVEKPAKVPANISSPAVQEQEEGLPTQERIICTIKPNLPISKKEKIMKIKFLKARPPRPQVARKSASIVPKPNEVKSISKVLDKKKRMANEKHINFLRDLEIKVQPNLLPFLRIDLFEQIYTKFSVCFHPTKLMAIVGQNVGQNVGQHFIFDNWTLSHLSTNLACTIMNLMKKSPAVLHTTISQLSSTNETKVNLADVWLPNKSKAITASPNRQRTTRRRKQTGHPVMKKRPTTTTCTDSSFTESSGLEGKQHIPRVRPEFRYLISKSDVAIHNKIQPVVPGPGVRQLFKEPSIVCHGYSVEERVQVPSDDIWAPVKMRGSKPVRKFPENSTAIRPIVVRQEEEIPEARKPPSAKEKKGRFHNIDLPTFTLGGLVQTVPSNITGWFTDKLFRLKGLAKSLESQNLKQKKTNLAAKFKAKEKKKSRPFKVRVVLGNVPLDPILDLADLKRQAETTSQDPICDKQTLPPPATAPTEVPDRSPQARQELSDLLKVSRKIEKISGQGFGKPIPTKTTPYIPPGWMKKINAFTCREEYVRCSDGLTVPSINCAIKNYITENSVGKKPPSPRVRSKLKVPFHFVSKPL